MTNSERDKVNGRFRHCLNELRLLQLELKRQGRDISAEAIGGAVSVVELAKIKVDHLNYQLEYAAKQ